MTAVTDSSPPSALVVGECLIDIIDSGLDSTTEHIGGSPCNVALGLARLGRTVEFLGQIGNDTRGRAIIERLEHSGVRLSPSAVDDHPTSTARARIQSDGSAEYVFDVLWNPKRPPIHPRSLLHTGSIAIVLQPGADTVTDLIEQHRDDATISIDLNIRPALIPDRTTTLAHLTQLMGLADVIKASDEDLRWLYPDRDPRAAAENWIEKGASLVAITYGDQGAYVASRTDELELNPYPATVFDTVGAGDAFMAGLLEGIWSQNLIGARHRHELGRLAGERLHDTLSNAHLAAALTVAKEGADLPTLAALKSARASYAT